MESFPKVTVVTINFNDAPLLRRTMRSVLAQQYPNLEYIVVDGGSTDGSLELIRQYAGQLARWVSEPDKGIFDAMNKGVRLSKGGFINFMNAGDEFAATDTILEVFRQCSGTAALIYGDHEVVYPSFSKHKQGKPAEGLWRHMMFSHQALFCKRELLLAHPFDIGYKIAADFHFIYNRFREGHRFEHVPVKVARYLAGGTSEAQVLKGYAENRKVVMEHDRRWKVKWFHAKLYAKQWLTIQLRKLLTEAVFLKLMEWKNK